jgi:hypothetical protein
MVTNPISQSLAGVNPRGRRIRGTFMSTLLLA